MEKVNLLRKNAVTNTRKIRRGLTFSPTTHVRNQYETVDPLTGTLKINRNNYKVNATNDDNMPGYTMHSNKFRPHSKSALQIAATKIAQMKRQKESNITYGRNGNFNNLSLANLNTGWKPALSSVGDAKWKPVNVPSAYRNRNAMKDFFGDKWVEADVLRERGDKEKVRLAAIANDEFKSTIQSLEKNFLQKTHNKAPSVLEREANLRINQLKITSGLKPEELKQRQIAVIRKLHADIAKLPIIPMRDFEADFMRARVHLQNQLAAAEKTGDRIYDSAPIGKPYAPEVRRTLSNRLRNAKNIANAASRNF